MDAKVIPSTSEETSLMRRHLASAMLLVFLFFLHSGDGRADQLTSTYVAKALSAALAYNPSENDNLARWEGGVSVRFYESCDKNIIGGRALQNILARSIEKFVSEVNQLQSSITIQFSRVPCNTPPPETTDSNFGIAVVVGGKLENVERIIEGSVVRKGAKSLLESIKRGSPSQFDTGCFASEFRNELIHQYQAGLAYIDPNVLSLSPEQCVRATILSALGFVGDMRPFPESIQSFSYPRAALSNLDACLIRLAYSNEIRPGMPVKQLIASVDKLAPALCAGVE